MLLEVKKNTEGKVNRMPDPISYLHLLERGKEINALLELESLDEEDRSELELIWNSLKSREESKFDAIISVIKECDRQIDRVEKEIRDLKKNHEHWKNKRKNIINLIKKAYEKQLISSMPTGNKYQATIRTVKAKLEDNFKSWTNSEKRIFGLKRKTVITRLINNEVIDNKEEEIPDKNQLREAIENTPEEAPSSAKLIKKVSLTYNLRRRIKTGI